MADALADRVDAWLRGEAPKPLTRRERAAMQLALEVLRRSVAGRRDAFVRTARAVNALSAAECILGYGFKYPSGPLAFVFGQGEPRTILCRLALYLRARLRADRSDCGPERYACSACGEVMPGTIVLLFHEHECRAGRSRTLYYAPTRRITPLWQRASEARR